MYRDTGALIGIFSATPKQAVAPVIIVVAIRHHEHWSLTFKSYLLLASTDPSFSPRPLLASLLVPFPLTSPIPPPLQELRHKLPMKRHDTAHPLRSWCKERGAKMQRAFFLAEAAAGNNAYARRVEQAETIKLVWLAALDCRLRNGSGWEVDGGEEVHGALYPD